MGRRDPDPYEDPIETFRRADRRWLRLTIVIVVIVLIPAVIGVLCHQAVQDVRISFDGCHAAPPPPAAEAPSRHP